MATGGTLGALSKLNTNLYFFIFIWSSPLKVKSTEEFGSPEGQVLWYYAFKANQASAPQHGGIEE